MFMTTETPVKKTRKSTSASSKTKKSKANHSDEQVQAMIAEAAYYRAERRGFQGDSQEIISDWLAAESEIQQSTKVAS
jgi:hypothetical protein